MALLVVKMLLNYMIHMVSHLNLTLEIAQESNLKVDEEGFKEELKLQQERSRGARVDNESMTSQKPDLMAFDCTIYICL